MPAELHMTPPEFSRLIAIEGITPDKTRTEEIEATEEECAALAERFGLRHLANLKGTVNIRRISGSDMIKIDGKLSADVVQACVVSLQDVHGHVDGVFDTYFTQNVAAPRDEMELTLDDDLEAAEIVTGGMIDMGEVVAQYLSLELDPYPRAPGVSLAAQMRETGTGGKANPFQVLAGLKEQEDEE
nr:MAG: hypothetical protein DIU80_23820 [Chloroflexota bacterium]